MNWKVGSTGHGLLLRGQLVVYHLAPAQEHGYPDAVVAPAREDGKYRSTVVDDRTIPQQELRKMKQSRTQ